MNIMCKLSCVSAIRSVSNFRPRAISDIVRDLSVHDAYFNAGSFSLVIRRPQYKERRF
jgi:hypothetical protein